MICVTADQNTKWFKTTNNVNFENTWSSLGSKLNCEDYRVVVALDGWDKDCYFLLFDYIITNHRSLVCVCYFLHFIGFMFYAIFILICKLFKSKFCSIIHKITKHVGF